MSLFSITTPTPRTFLFVPSMPTPNGRLHLGHIAGPLLRLDAAARYFASLGHQVRLVTGTDAYESHVVLRAREARDTPRAIAAHYTSRIRQALSALQIRCDSFVDPLGDGSQVYEHHVSAVMHRLVAAGAARHTGKRYPYAAKTGAYLPRSYLAGRCPGCKKQVSGNVCEACGRQFLAEEVVDPRLRADLPSSGELGPLGWRSAKALSINLAASDQRLTTIEGAIRSLNLPARYRNIAIRHVRESRMAMELSVPGQWGVPWLVPGGEGQVVNTYSTPYAWSLIAGELCGALTGTNRNALAVDADVTTITSFGVDIAACWIAGTVGLATLDSSSEPRFRHYDHYWGNEFLRLEGDKFSTSRGHVIWADDLINSTPVNADMTRFYLASIDPATAETDFNIAGFVGTVNDVVLSKIYGTASAMLEKLEATQPGPPSADMLSLLRRFFAQHEECYDLSGARLAAAAALVPEWIDAGKKCLSGAATEARRDDRYWFLKGLAVLSAPLLSEFSQHLWQRLGAADDPNLPRFAKATTPTPGCFRAPLRTLHASTLRSCLPDTLREHREVATRELENPTPRDSHV